MTALRDDEQRQVIREDTERTLFVEAGAGSGKTKSLIDRVATLVLERGVPLRQIAAVTFTEKAGAELRDRLREAFEAARRHSPAGEPLRALADDALDDLDSAAIGTLHSFAQRILTRHPIEAGLPPLVEVLDEVGSGIAFDERWARMRTELLDDETVAEPLLLAMSAGVTLEHLRSLARAFGKDWDLITDRVLTAEMPLAAGLPDLSSLVDEAARLLAKIETCTDETDLFIPPLRTLGAWGERLGSVADAGQQLEILSQAAGLKWGHGRQPNWGANGELVAMKDACKQLQSQAADIVHDVVDSTLRALAYWIAGRVRVAADERRAEGRLEFHDLLVLARDLLRTNEEARGALQRAFPRLLLDEFQDTDPIQIELAVRIAGGAVASQPRWEDIDIPPGSLFVVGDPKQSIYRFRRADIAMYLRAQQELGAGDHTVELTTNFRTTGPILDWVNAVFANVITPIDHVQPAYLPLDPHRGDSATGPSVLVVGAEAHADDPNADTLREREAADVATVIRRALDETWTVWDERSDAWRPIRLGDVAVLVPARTSLPFLEEALDTAGVSYRAESSSLVYQAQEVRDLLAAARAVADPSDALALVTALRSPLFGCGDDDLWTWKQAGRGFNLLAPPDDALREHPVGAAMAYLKQLYRDAQWLTPSEVLGQLVADRRILEVAAMGPRARDQWRRLRFVVDQARAWSEVEHGGLRAYLAWAARQGEEASRVAEAVLPETDTDAVRVMTVHAAKGVEFPMVVLSGMSAQPRVQSGVQLLWPPAGGYAVSLRKDLRTVDFDEVKPIDEQMDAQERRRLLYVATTRARDHLVVSLHRKEGGQETNAKLLADAGAHAEALVERFVAPHGAVSATSSGVAALDPPPDWDAWLAELEFSRAASRFVPAISASGLEGTEPAVVLAEPDAADASAAVGSAKGGRDVDLPPWSKGRYGSAVGRAVHGVLQVVDLATGAGLDDAVTAQCVAEGVLDYADVVRALVQSALESDLVKRAATRENWREMYVGTVRADGRVLEGFIDLVYREDDGSLVIVDYKTDAVPAAALPTLATYYAPQLQAYVQALGASPGTRRNVPLSVRGMLLFCAPAGASTVPANP